MRARVRTDASGKGGKSRFGTIRYTKQPRRRNNVRFHSRTARACQPSHALCAHTADSVRRSYVTLFQISRQRRVSKRAEPHISRCTCTMLELKAFLFIRQNHCMSPHAAMHLHTSGREDARLRNPLLHRRAFVHTFCAPIARYGSCNGSVVLGW